MLREGTRHAWPNTQHAIRFTFHVSRDHVPPLRSRALCRILDPCSAIAQLTERLVDSYAQAGGINHLDGKNLPSKRAIALITMDLLRLLFPGFFDEKPIHSSEIKQEVTRLLTTIAAEPGTGDSQEPRV